MSPRGWFAFVILTVMVTSYGLGGISYAQVVTDPADCGPDEVIVNGQCVNAFEGEEPIIADFTLDTDSSDYNIGDTVTISGNIPNLDPNFVVAVTITVLDAKGNIVTIAQLTPDSSGDFTKSIKAGGPLWKESGTYQVKAQYGVSKAATTFSFIAAGTLPDTTPPPACGPNEELINGQCVEKEPELPECGPGTELVDGVCQIIKEPEPPECGPNEELINGQCVEKEPEPQCGPGTELVNGVCQAIQQPEPEGGGGCLIATAAYGSELAPQVQFLREVRDNTVLSTTTGTSFMAGFNQLYYSFSPTIADWERQNAIFKESVKAFITPMVSTLSIMTLADSGSESEVLAFGISVIALNLGIYIATPTIVAFQVRKYLKSRN